MCIFQRIFFENTHTKKKEKTKSPKGERGHHHRDVKSMEEFKEGGSEEEADLEGGDSEYSDHSECEMDFEGGSVKKKSRRKSIRMSDGRLGESGVSPLSDHLKQKMKKHNESMPSQSNLDNLANMKNLDNMIKKLTSKFCKPEDMLITKGGPGDSIFFLSKGIIEIFIDDPR
mmetsp:Transcript_13970/g.21786  ORF Transcript_13970/g.21786 Transcript_13970/m.21786 type:complete len:172 (+) Transcript_13970:1330-1845(+)